MFKHRRRKGNKKSKMGKKHERYTFFDFLSDVVFYAPEIIFWPFRLLWYGIRAIVRFFDWT